MPRIKNVMDIFKLLDKSNCRKCQAATCLAFAASVFQGKKQLNECPKIGPELLEMYGTNIDRQKTIEESQEELITDLKLQVHKMDLFAAANRTGGKFINDRLNLKVFGKDFDVDISGNLHTDIHINPWVTIPLLNYILKCAGTPIKGEWVPFRELDDGRAMQGLFGQQCEKPFKKVADTYPDLFEDLMYIFNGKNVKSHDDADISLSLLPLPKVPILICYWKPEEDLESDLKLFFDISADKNCGIEGIYSLGTGIVRMFEKLASRHGVKEGSVNLKKRS